MDWEQAYKDLIANYWIKESQWKFETSAGGEASPLRPPESRLESQQPAEHSGSKRATARDR
jgi:hypothetical protein